MTRHPMASAGAHTRGIRTRVLLLFMILSFFAGPGWTIPYDTIESARRGDDHAVRKLLEKDPELARSTDARGFTPLHWAGIRGNWRIFRYLLDAGADANAVGGDGGTPLHWTSHHDRADMVALLLAGGADVDLANQWGRTPLHVAARRDCRSVAGALLDAGADPNAATKEGWTPLHVASMAGHADLVELLLARGGDPDREDAEGKRPSDRALTRPAAIALTGKEMDDFVGIFDLPQGGTFKVWREGDGLRIREFAPDGLYPIGKDEFYCVQEPWRVAFRRDEAGVVAGIEVAFLRRTVRGERRDHPWYVGSQACRECHLGGEHGDEYLQWVRSRHAAAYWRLATDWAGLLASFRPAHRDVSDPTADDRCLLCHVTAAQDPDALLADSYRPQEGVGCEACHGPGSLYMDAEVMADREQFLARGGIVPDEETCRRCHRNAERFDFASWWPKIAHKKDADAEGGGTHGDQE